MVYMKLDNNRWKGGFQIRNDEECCNTNDNRDYANKVITYNNINGNNKKK